MKKCCICLGIAMLTISGVHHVTADSTTIITTRPMTSSERQQFNERAARAKSGKEWTPTATSIDRSFPAMAEEWIPFASESSPRQYNWIDKKGVRHATNDPNGVPPNVVKDLEGKPEGTWIDENGMVRELKDRLKTTKID